VIDEKTGEEDFAEAVSAAKRKSVVMKNFRYCVFDLIPKADFEGTFSETSFSQRQVALEAFVSRVNHPRLRKAHQTLYTEENFLTMSQEAEKQNWEGLMLRMDCPYRGKRTNEILKCKKFSREEYVVVDVEPSLMRIIDKETGLETEVETLGSVVIEHKGTRVGVGSGFSHEERHRFHADPDLIIGKTISVQYFEESQDSRGKPSLRFPTFKCLYGEERTV
jgi:DNA ligase-1